MITVACVRLKKPGKIYYFDAGNLELERGMHVIVDTAMGEEYGEVVIPRKEIEESAIADELKKVIRITTHKDDKMLKEYKEKEPEAYKICLEKIKADEELYRLLNHFRRENVELHYHDGSLKEEAILERTYSKLLMNEDVRAFLHWEEKTLSIMRMIHEEIDGSLKLDFDFI
jgi:hypothetical protein